MALYTEVGRYRCTVMEDREVDRRIPGTASLARRAITRILPGLLDDRRRCLEAFLRGPNRKARVGRVPPPTRRQLISGRSKRAFDGRSTKSLLSSLGVGTIQETRDRGSVGTHTGQFTGRRVTQGFCCLTTSSEVRSASPKSRIPSRSRRPPAWRGSKSLPQS